VGSHFHHSNTRRARCWAKHKNIDAKPATEPDCQARWRKKPAQAFTTAATQRSQYPLAWPLYPFLPVAGAWPNR